MEHDIAMVYQVQNEVLKKVLADLPETKNATYFSDGCASQYKNRKNLFNLCQHSSEFGINAKWVFFATSHGKKLCDGIGGTVERLTRFASLGRATSDQVLTCTVMFNFCKDNIEEINFIYLLKNEVDATWAKFAKRFDNIRTIPGTRSFHKFISITPNEIGVKFCSENQDICQTHNFGNDVSVPESLNLKVLEYVCCTYSKNVWIGLITDIDMGGKDVKIKFLHPSMSSTFFVWPQRDDLI